jgi:hypothetical protein
MTSEWTATKQLELDVLAFIQRHTEKPKPYRRKKLSDEIWQLGGSMTTEQLNAANFRFT